MTADRLELLAALHRTLGDVHRLGIVETLLHSDRTPSELRAATGLSSNLLAFHLDALEEVGLVSRHRSEGDRRRRYVRLHERVLAEVGVPVRAPCSPAPGGTVLFVCRRNSARSQLAAALWSSRTGGDALSAGTDPAPRVHRHAVSVARRHGLDLTDAKPRGFDDVDTTPGLVVSVCDLAREAAIPFDAPLLHWSVADPVGGGVREFERVYRLLADRVEHLASAVAA